MGNPQRYSKEFQERAVRRMKLGENVTQNPKTKPF